MAAASPRREPRSSFARPAAGRPAMAQDMVEVMTKLGHDRFAVVGHDRGARVAYHAALDHPSRVEALAVLDIVPTLETWQRTDMTRALTSFHWGSWRSPSHCPSS